ncbi:MAG: DUF2145 domain-containing protein [Rhodoferax sp.]|nr:DUF2145 domain-containing protein [Rhodoferax sp.]
MSACDGTFRQGLAALLVAGVLAVAGPAAWAGRSCEPQKPAVRSLESGLAMAAKTLQALQASGERVVILARSGQDLRKYGLRYSHFGLAYQQPDGQGGTVWRVVHKLNTCGTATSDIYRQGLGEFFLDDPWRYEAAWVALTPALQERLLPLLLDDAWVLRMHQRAYSMVSYPWSTRFQQSNQWVIETLSMAAEPGVATREAAQAWLRFKGYEPTALKLGAFERLGARITAANISFDDHPNEKRFADRIETVTVDSAFDWLQRAGLGQRPVEIQLQASGR